MILETDTDDESTPQLEKNSKEVRPDKILKEATINFLITLSLCCGIEADSAQTSSIRLLSGLIRHIIYNGNKVPECTNQTAFFCRMQQAKWANLGFARSISASKSMAVAFTTPAWLNLLLSISGKQDPSLTITLPLQILALRMMRTVLPFWNTDISSKITFLNKLFHLMGYTVLTCQNDASLQQESKFSKPRVPLTSTHSSTIGEECVLLLRSLHSLPGWDHCLNQFLSAKLGLAGELLTNGPLLSIQVCKYRDEHVNFNLINRMLMQSVLNFNLCKIVIAITKKQNLL